MSHRHAEAKAAIIAAFPPDVDPMDAVYTHPPEFYLATLRVIRGRIPFRRTKENQSLIFFLWAGCVRFDRWFAPSPPVVSPDQRAQFAEIVDALCRAGGPMDNAACFRVHAIRDDVYSEFDRVPLRSVDVDRVEEFRRRATALPHPLDGTKLREFEAAKAQLFTLLDGIADGTLRTVFSAELPYVVPRSSLEMEFTWKGMKGWLTLTPTFAGSRETAFVAGAVAEAVGASRWQSGITSVQIVLEALVDDVAWTPALQLLQGHYVPGDGWPQCYSLSFAIVSEIVWKLKVDGLVQCPWVPAPRDLGTMNCKIQTAKTRSIDERTCTSPALMILAFTADTTARTVQLGELGGVLWSAKCHVLSRMYLELGDTNESLFWLNVAAEALLKERFEDMCTRAERPELLSELESAKPVWADAESIVAAQFPKLAGKIQWPDTQVQPSVYAKLKYLYKELQVRGTPSEARKNYSIIARGRNALFHGASDARVPVADVNAALEAFAWLRSNLDLSVPSVAPNSQ